MGVEFIVARSEKCAVMVSESNLTHVFQIFHFPYHICKRICSHASTVLVRCVF